MAILLNDNLDIAAVKPTDNRYGPHATVAAAKAAISPTRRYVGLTVGIVTGGTVDEYWFKSGILDVDLVVKTITITAGATVNTPAGNIAATDVQTALNELDTEKVSKSGDTIAGGTRTTAGTTLVITETLNNAGVVFPGTLVINQTNTASASGSLLVDFQVGGVSKFKVSNSGSIVLSNPYSSLDVPSGGNLSDTGTSIVRWSVGILRVGANVGIGWASSGSAADTNSDTILVRAAAGTIAQRNGTSPQTSLIYNTSANSDVDFERAYSKWSANVFEVGTEYGGTGVARDATYTSSRYTTLGGAGVYVGNGNTDFIRFYNHGYTMSMYYSQFAPQSAGEVDLKSTDGNIGWGYLLAGHKTLTNTSGTTAMAEIRPTYNQTSGTASNTDFLVNRTETAIGSGAQLLMDLQVGGSSKFKVGRDGGVTFLGDSGIVSAGNIRLWSSGSASVIVRNSINTANLFEVSGAGNVGIGVAATTYKLEVNGSFAATTKSFVIDHPTKPDMKLRYGSLEGPENGVYVRGRTQSRFIHLPDYWTKLVDPLSISVSLTAIGWHQSLCVVHIENNLIEIANVNLLDESIDCFYVVYGERADVDKLVVEIPK